MFLVRVVSGQVGIVLIVNRACGLGAGEVAGAGALGDDDFGGGGRVGDGVAADFAWDVDVFEGGAGGADFFEPADGEDLVGGEGIDRDDGTEVSGCDADGKGVEVAGGEVGLAAGNVAG